MINPEYAATFLALAACGNFREAAQRTGLSQPAVSQHLKRLEQSLQVSLVERSRAGSRLTAEGRAFLPYAESLLRVSGRAEALFARSSLAIGASSNIGIYLLPPYLKAYRDRVSHQLELVIGPNTLVAERLQSLAIDVAIMEWWDQRPGFSATVWRSEGMRIIVAPDHPWADMPAIALDMLKGVPMLGGESGTGTGRLLQQCLGETASAFKVSMQLGSTEAVKHAVHAGLGISLVMAAAVAEECRTGWLRAIPLENDPLRKDLYIVRPATAPETGLAAGFAQFLQPHRG